MTCLKEFPFHLQSILNICATGTSKITQRFCNDLQVCLDKKNFSNIGISKAFGNSSVVYLIGFI